MTIENQLNIIINDINSSNFSLNEKIRYAYIELGKLVHKDVLFFYTIGNKLDGKGEEHIKYPTDKVTEMMNDSNYFDYLVICKTVADMLKHIFDKCGIESEIRKETKTKEYVDENGRKVEIVHYFLCATGEEGKKYALTLTADLANIQIGRQTAHFGNLIKRMRKEKYYDDAGKEQYREVPAYEGEKIDFTEMSPAELWLLDAKIGYLKDFSINHGKIINPAYTDCYFTLISKCFAIDNLPNASISNKESEDAEYKRFLVQNTEFYRDLYLLLTKKQSLTAVLENTCELSEEEINDAYLEFTLNEEKSIELKTFVIYMVITALCRNNNIESSRKDALNIALSAISPQNYKAINVCLQRKFGAYNKKYNGQEYLMPSQIIKALFDLLDNIDKYVTITKNSGEKKASIDELKKMRNSITQNIYRIGLLFVEKNLLMSKIKGEDNQLYIYQKTVFAFEKIFDIGYKTNFNNLKFGEQIIIIKDVMDIIFSKLAINVEILPEKDEEKNENPTEKNKDKKNSLEKPKSAIDNYTLKTAIISKDDNKLYYLIIIKNFVYPNHAFSIIFDTENNRIIKNMSLFDIYAKFWVIRDDELNKMIKNDLMLSDDYHVKH